MTQGNTFTKSIIFTPLYDFSTLQAEDIGQTLLVLDALSEMLNGSFLHYALKQFDEIRGNSDVLLARHEFKHYGRICRDLTEHIKSRHQDTYSNLQSPDVIALKGLAFELVYCDQHPVLTEIDDRHLQELCSIVGNIANMDSTLWNRPIVMRITVFRCDDAVSVEFAGKTLGLGQASDGLFIGPAKRNVHEPEPALRIPWGESQLAINPIVTLPPDILRYPVSEVLSSSIMVALLAAELTSIQSMIDYTVVQLHIARFNFTSLFQRFIDNNSPFKWYVRFRKEVLTDLADQFESSSRALIVEEDSHVETTMLRVYGSGLHEHLDELTSHLGIFHDQLTGSLQKCQVQNLPAGQSSDKLRMLEQASGIRENLSKLRPQLREFGESFEQRVSDLLAQMEIEVAGRGVQVAIILGFISIVLTAISLALVLSVP